MKKVESPATQRDFASDYRIVLLFSLAAYLACVWLRLLELPLWNNPAFFAGGERLMGTHDAYAWLAGAKGINRFATEDFSRLVALLSKLTGASLGTVGFWLPAVTAPLAALPMCYLAMRWGAGDAVLTSGVAAGGCFAYLIRTRLGYLDTDVFTLLLPEMVAAALAVWVESFTRRGWFAPSRGEADRVRPERVWIAAAVTAVLIRAYLEFYSSGYPVAAALLGMAGVIGLLTCDAKGWPYLAGSAVLIVCGLFLGWWVLPLAILVLVLLRLRPGLFQGYRPALVMLAILAGVMLISGSYKEAYEGLISPVLNYLKPASRTVSSAISLPSPYQSVREAQNLELAYVVDFLAGNIIIFAIFLAGLGYLAWKKPASLIFLPFLVLALASVRLGQRFAMYFGPSLALGLGTGAALIAIRLTRSAKAVLFSQLLIFLALIAVLYFKCQILSPAPCLPKALAETLIETGKITPKDARLWLWWDYGYAAQYFAGRDTFADGGANQGMRLYALAVAHTTPSPLQADQIMRYATDIQMQFYAQNRTAVDRDADQFGVNFYHAGFDAFTNSTPQVASSIIDSLGKDHLPWPKDMPPQYIVVTWENMSLSYWISYFGSWNVATGGGTHGRIIPVRDKVQITLSDGVMHLADRDLPLAGAYIMNRTPAESKNLKWQNDSSYTLLMSAASNQAFLADGQIASAMLTRLLLDDPKEFAPYFKLVYDNYPWARVYLAQ